MDSVKAWTYTGSVHFADKRRTCPECTKILRYLEYHDMLCSRPVECIPRFLVKRINKKTGDWFWGCPNFPKCKYSVNRPKTKREKDIETRAWANGMFGPIP